MTNITVPQQGDAWWQTPQERRYLLDNAMAQFAFFRPSLDAAGGFHAQDYSGAPILNAPRELHATTRMVHAFSLAHQLGVQGADDMIDHGLKSLWRYHRDADHGGYMWSFAPGGAIIDDKKLAYGHVFVLLAAASAKQAGHPDADRLLEDVWDTINVHFWDHNFARMKEEYARDWAPISSYRGMNANMHATEALLAATEATGDKTFAAHARMIFDFFIGTIAPHHGWRIPEHYTQDWQIDADYEGNPMFRPAGATPGHSLELSRLLLQAWDMGGRHDKQLVDWSDHLYRQAIQDGWDTKRGGGILYTVDAAGRPLRKSRYWWPVTEAIGAAAARLKHAPDAETAEQYRLFWHTAQTLFIDEKRGGWYPEIDDQNRPDSHQFEGKPDIYHSIQAALYPLVPGLSGAMKELPALKADLA